MQKDKQPIIIKKIKKQHHEGHHGGAWKVAYADFITAMMALFLVLWLVAMLSIEAKKAVAQYFRSYTIFKGSEAGGGKGISVMRGNPIKLDPESGGVKRGIIFRSSDIAMNLHKSIEKKLYDLKDQVLIFTTKDGVRVEVAEKEGSLMFERGKARLLPQGKKVLQVISETLKDIPNTINIEGHTDSYQYREGDYTNWELAADRANAARRELIKNGLKPEKITKITSFADKIPLNPENTYDPINRRVSILVEVDETLP